MSHDMIRDTIHIIWLTVFGGILLVICFFYGMSNFKATQSQQMLVDVTGTMAMKDRDDSARVMRETFFLIKPNFEKDVIDEFTNYSNVNDTTSAVFTFTYDDGVFNTLVPENKRSVYDLNNHTREVITYTLKPQGNVRKLSDYTVSKVKYYSVQTETKTVDGKEKKSLKLDLTKEESRKEDAYNRSIKQITVRATVNAEKEYQATYFLDTRGPDKEEQAAREAIETEKAADAATSTP